MSELAEKPTIGQRLDNYAERAFRDMADGDYILARMAYRAELDSQFLWCGQQALEKYLKCILLLRRISADKVQHDLEVALQLIDKHSLKLNLRPESRSFIDRLNDAGQSRYFAKSFVIKSPMLMQLDRTVWDLRRFCTRDEAPSLVNLQHLKPPPIVQIGGYLERIVAEKKHPSRAALVWQNGFFGRRGRASVRHRAFLTAKNSPLDLHPALLTELARYIYLPKAVKNRYSAD